MNWQLGLSFQNVLFFLILTLTPPPPSPSPPVSGQQIRSILPVFSEIIYSCTGGINLKKNDVFNNAMAIECLSVLQSIRK